MKLFIRGVSENYTNRDWVPITLERYYQQFSMDLCAVATKEEIDMLDGAALIFGTTAKPNLIQLYPLTYQGAICMVDMPWYFIKVVV